MRLVCALGLRPRRQSYLRLGSLCLCRSYGPALRLEGRLKDRLGERIVGQDKVIHHVLTALFAGGHGLLEGVPGIGKTKSRTPCFSGILPVAIDVQTIGDQNPRRKFSLTIGFDAHD